MNHLKKHNTAYLLAFFFTVVIASSFAVPDWALLAPVFGTAWLCTRIEKLVNKH